MQARLHFPGFLCKCCMVQQMPVMWQTEDACATFEFRTGTLYNLILMKINPQGSGWDRTNPQISSNNNKTWSRNSHSKDMPNLHRWSEKIKTCLSKHYPSQVISHFWSFLNSAPNHQFHHIFTYCLHQKTMQSLPLELGRSDTRASLKEMLLLHVWMQFL